MGALPMGSSCLQSSSKQQASQQQQRCSSLVVLAVEHGLPAVVRQSLLPLFKKGSPAACGNYRGIQLISLLRKVIGLVLAGS